MDQNRLLRAMAPEGRASLDPFFERVELRAGEVLEQQGKETKRALFLESGLAAVVARSPGRSVGVGVIGCDGVTALELLHCAGKAGHDVVVQADATALQIDSGKLEKVMETDRAVRTVLLRYAQFFTVQSSQTALTNVRASVEERLARWILMSHDRMQNGVLRVTHKFIALMLGVRRAGVTDAMHLLEGKRLLKSLRNTILVLDRQGLVDVTAGAYGICESEYERLIDFSFRQNVRNASASLPGMPDDGTRPADVAR